MFFNSLSFAIFLPIVFLIYWFFLNKKLQNQNIFLLAGSYFFYSCWDWRFLFLLFFSTMLDFYTGIKMQDALAKSKKQFWFWLSISVNLGFLGIFKYYNFFAISFVEAVSLIGFKVHPTLIKVILPVGISFYTFHGLSYVIDIYYDRIEAEKKFVDYALFVSFFPLLVAGPIERATHLLPQIKKERNFHFHQAVDGLRQILWGLFKKIVIADNCAIYADQIFGNYQNLGGSTLLMGAFFFSIQIYCDFSGYSDMALGIAKLFGFTLLRNFNYPYFSRNIAEFWRKWHISLSSWFKDYLYIPLGGSRVDRVKSIRNTIIIFLVSGFWHGANWTFIAWGLLNALYFLPSQLLGFNRNYINIVAEKSKLPSLFEGMQIFFTFLLITVAWIFFRAETITQAFDYIRDIFNKTLFNLPSVLPKALLLLIISFFIVEWLGRTKWFPLENFNKTISSRTLRWTIYMVLAFLIILYQGQEHTFIYFQF